MNKRSESGLLSIFDEHNDQLEKEVRQGKLAKSTWSKYRTIRSRFSEYISDRFNKEDLEFSEIRRSFANDFHDYLTEDRRLSNNTAVTYVEMIAKIFRIVRRKGLIDFDITHYYSHQKKENIGVDYLTIDEIYNLEDVELDTVEQKRVRDLFLFSCYTGLSFERLKELNVIDDLDIEEDGTHWVYIERGYFWDELVVPLNFDGEGIIDLYEDERIANDSIMVFPFSFPDSIQNILIEISVKAGISRRLDFDIARHFFALTYAVENNYSNKLIRNVLGDRINMKTKQIQEGSDSELVKLFDISNDVFRN